jgi:hypothetical protein
MNNAERVSNRVRSELGTLVRGKALNPGKPLTFAEAVTLLMMAPFGHLVMWPEGAYETGYVFHKHEDRARLVTERVALRGFEEPPTDEELELGAQMMGVQVSGACLTPWLLSMPVWTVCERSTVERVTPDIVTSGDTDQQLN